MFFLYGRELIGDGFTTDSTQLEKLLKYKDDSQVLEKLQAMCRYFQVTMDQLTGAEEAALSPPPRPSRETAARWIRLGAALCAGGGLGILGLGAAMLLRPASLTTVDASAAITLNGSGLLLLLLLLIMGAGAILVLWNHRR